MPQINLNPKLVIAGVLLIIVVLLSLFSEFLLPLAIILVPIAIVFGFSQFKKQG